MLFSIRLKFSEFLFFCSFVSPFSGLSPYPCTPSVANDDFSTKSACPCCKNEKTTIIWNTKNEREAVKYGNPLNFYVETLHAVDLDALLW